MNQKKKVLIIEDDQDTSEILGIIAELMNLDVIRSPQALPVNEIEKLAPDLILLDHWIGDQLGGDLCKQLKAHPVTKNIPVIMLSAHNNIEQIAKEACANAYIAKPFDLDDMQDIITRFLG
jgi:two-component system phosphate regulon response regulator PhoB